MRVIVTRPEREATSWGEQLAARGIETALLPLIAIGPVPGEPARQALASAWRQRGQYFALMFVSANAVTYFFASNEGIAHTPSAFSAIDSGVDQNLAPQCWAPGPGTARALQEVGVPAQAIRAPSAHAGAQFDSEALWQQVRTGLPSGARVLIVRGSDDGASPAGRDWLARQLAGAGVQVDTVAAYARGVPAFSAAQAELAGRAARDGSVWLFSSSQAIRHLVQWLPTQDWGGARAVATHPRIAEAARQAGFAVVCESRPTLDEVVASIESMAWRTVTSSNEQNPKGGA